MMFNIISCVKVYQGPFLVKAQVQYLACKLSQLVELQFANLVTLVNV